jgi:Mn2+/Fe2+ NRAMP family transporter
MGGWYNKGVLPCMIIWGTGLFGVHIYDNTLFFPAMLLSVVIFIEIVTHGVFSKTVIRLFEVVFPLVVEMLCNSFSLVLKQAREALAEVMAAYHVNKHIS